MGSLYFTINTNRSEDGFFLDLYEESIKKMTKAITARSEEEQLEHHGYRLLYSYINLFGAWLFHFYPTHKENKNLKRFIRKNDFLSFPVEDRYPDYFVSDDYHNLGMNVWLFQDEGMLKTLRDKNIYLNFDKFLNIRR